MADKIHPVVELLAARMESHPEEFPVNPNGQLPIMGRWAPWLAQAEHLMDDAERTLLYTKAKEAIFQRIHEEVLDELLNGPERRAKEAEEQEYERNLAASVQHMRQQQARQLLTAQQQVYDVDRDMYRSAGITHITGAGPSLKAVGTTGTGETLASTIEKLKKFVRK